MRRQLIPTVYAGIFIIFAFNFITSVSYKHFLTFHWFTEGKKIVSASIDATKIIQKLDICPKEYCILGVEYLHHIIPTKNIAKGLQDRIVKYQVKKINITNIKGIFTDVNLKKATEIKDFTLSLQERDTI